MHIDGLNHPHIKHIRSIYLYANNVHVCTIYKYGWKIQFIKIKVIIYKSNVQFVKDFNYVNKTEL